MNKMDVGRGAGTRIIGQLHLDETRALQPLERTSEWDAGELPETYPTTL